MNEQYVKRTKVELYNDHFENAKTYNIPHAQLIIADIPYNLGNNAYASNPQWYVDGDNKNGESKLAGKSFFDTDNDFRINNFFDFCTRYLNKEPKKAGERGKSSNAPAMIVFCAFEQIPMVIEQGKKTWSYEKLSISIYQKLFKPSFKGKYENSGSNRICSSSL